MLKVAVIDVLLELVSQPIIVDRLNVVEDLGAKTGLLFFLDFFLNDSPQVRLCVTEISRLHR